MSGTKLQVHVRNTAGHVKFSDLTSMCFRDAQLVLIVFDCFEAWLQQGRRHNKTKDTTMLVIKVSSTARESTQADSLIFVETSVAQAYGVFKVSL